MFLLLAIFTFALAQNRVAIMDFRNNGSPDYNYLESGIASMLGTTLATSEKIQVVERGQLEKILREMNLGMSGLIDPQTAARVGNMAGARLVVIGSFINLGSAIRIDAKVVNVETGVVVPGATASAKAATVEELDGAVDELARKLLINLTGETVLPAVQGNPNLPGRFEFTYDPSQPYGVLIDGNVLEPDHGLQAIVELAPGKHRLQIIRYSGLLKTETEYETDLEIPGGYVVRAVYREGKLNIYEIMPLPGSTTSPTGGGSGAQITIGSTESSVRVESKIDRDFRTTTEISLPAGGQTAASAPSKIIFMSEEGMCDVYIDGQKKASLPMSGIDEMARATVFDLSPGTYHIKIEGFEVWYEGTLRVNPGEEIKIKVEPGQFRIISRSPLPVR